MNQGEKKIVLNRSCEEFDTGLKSMTVVSPTHFTLPPVELHIAGAGRSVIRAKILRASRLYDK